MKNLFWIGLVLFLGCGILIKKEKSVAPEKVNGEPMLLGNFSRADMEKYFPVFKDNLIKYKPSPEVIRTFAELQNPIRVKIFVGTWCGDTKREVPRFFKILDESKTQMIEYELIGMNRTKMDPDRNEKNYDITNLPTFIFYREGKEIGRFIESPRGRSTDEDFIQILQSVTSK